MLKKYQGNAILAKADLKAPERAEIANRPNLCNFRRQRIQLRANHFKVSYIIRIRIKLDTLFKSKNLSWLYLSFKKYFRSTLNARGFGNTESIGARPINVRSLAWNQRMIAELPFSLL